MLLAIVLTLPLAAWGTPQASQEKELKNPLAGNPEAIHQGKAIFRLFCAPCHGMEGRGASRGPDLTTGRWTHGGSDAAVFRTITKGVPGTEMPSNDFPDVEVWATIAYLRSLGAGTSAPVGGNREAGEQIYSGKGNCAQCHMVNGRGGRLGPDLSRIGASRPTKHLAEKVRQPNKEVTPGYETASVLTRDGRRIIGVRKNEDTFSIQLMDHNEQLHLFLKKDLQEVKGERGSLMPGYNTRMLSEQELRDLLAYMDGLRGR